MGEIFEKYGWNESNSVLYLNIGSTWLDEKDWKASMQAYRKSLEYARAAGDSLMVSNAYSGIGERLHRRRKERGGKCHVSNDEKLNDRELSILRLMAEGKTTESHLI